MKKAFIIVFALLATVARADERSGKALGAMSAAIRALGAYEMRFTVNAGSEMAPMEGVAVVSGNRYNISLPTGELLGDDKTAYTIDPASKTATLTPVDPKDRSLLSNPARAFDLLDGAFTHRYAGTVKISGRECAEIELTPIDNTLPIRKLSLFVDSGTSLPVALRYAIEGLDAPVTVEIKSIKSLPQADASKFVFDKKRYKGYEVIDLR